jgi:hypothetical protein
MLRHTFCSHLAMRGAPARANQELAGHQDLTTTQRYMHLSPAALDNAIRAARVFLNAPQSGRLWGGGIDRNGELVLVEQVSSRAAWDDFRNWVFSWPSAQ